MYTEKELGKFRLSHKDEQKRKKGLWGQTGVVVVVLWGVAGFGGGGGEPGRGIMKNYGNLHWEKGHGSCTPEVLCCQSSAAPRPCTNIPYLYSPSRINAYLEN